MVFVFGVTAAVASFATEAVTRFLGLRGRYLLIGIRELVDNGQVTTDLSKAGSDYKNMQQVLRGKTPAASATHTPAPAATIAAPEPSAPAPATAPATSAAAAPALSATGALLGGPILGNQGMVGQLSSRLVTLGQTEATGLLARLGLGKKTGQLPTMKADQTAGSLRKQLRSLPSYIPGQSFAEAVMDLVLPSKTGHTSLGDIVTSVEKLPEDMPLRTSLVALAKNADGDVSRFRDSVESWYDDHMDRVSGWYKQHAARITLAVGAVLIVLFNVNALTIGRTLYSDTATSAAISTVAANATNCSTAQDAKTGLTPQQCLAQLQSDVSASVAAGLPLGWGTVRDCQDPKAKCNWMDQRGLFSRHGHSLWQLLLAILGFLVVIIAIVPGAQFWFGLLSKIGTLRSTGPKPAGSGT